MKKVTITLLVAFAVILLVSSCQKKTCPAYAKATVENINKKNA